MLFVIILILVTTIIVSTTLIVYKQYTESQPPPTTPTPLPTTPKPRPPPPPTPTKPIPTTPKPPPLPPPPPPVSNCSPTSANLDNFAKTYKTNSTGVCVSDTCKDNYSLVSGKCLYNLRGQRCTSTSIAPYTNYTYDNYGNCMASSCNGNYIFKNGACLPPTVLLPKPLFILSEVIKDLINRPVYSAGIVMGIGTEIVLENAFGKPGFNRIVKKAMVNSSSKFVSAGSAGLRTMGAKIGSSGLTKLGLAGGKLAARETQKALAGAAAKTSTKLAKDAAVAGSTGPGSIFVGPALFAVSMVSLGLDIGNVGGYANYATLSTFNDTRTANNQAILEAASQAKVTYPIPIGPLDKISVTKQQFDVANIMGFLYDVSVDNPRLISYTEKINLLKPMLTKMLNDASSGVITDSQAVNNVTLFDSYKEIVSDTLLKTAMYIYCKLNGGNNVVDNKGNLYCTYETKDQCDKSYTWPPDNTDSLPPGDIYGEWKNMNFKPVTSVANLPSSVAKSGDSTGVCVQGSYAVKQMCYKSGIPYDAESGLCIITPSYCERGGMNYTHTNKLANGVNPDLPDCKLGKAGEIFSGMFGDTLTKSLNNASQKVFCDVPILGGLCTQPKKLLEKQVIVMNNRNWQNTSGTIKDASIRGDIIIYSQSGNSGILDEVSWRYIKDNVDIQLIIVLNNDTSPCELMIGIASIYKSGIGGGYKTTFAWDLFSRKKFLLMFSRTIGFTYNLAAQLKASNGIVLDYGGVTEAYNPVMKFMDVNATKQSVLNEFMNVFRSIESSYPQLAEIFIAFPGLYVYCFNNNRSEVYTFLNSNITKLQALAAIYQPTNNLKILSHLVMKYGRCNFEAAARAIANTLVTNQYDRTPVWLYINEITMSSVPYIFPSTYSEVVNRINFMQFYLSTNLPVLFFLVENPGFISILVNDPFLQVNLITKYEGIDYNTISNMFNNYLSYINIPSFKKIIQFSPDILKNSDVINYIIENKELMNLVNNDPVNHMSYYNFFKKDFIEYPEFSILLKSNSNLMSFFASNYYLTSVFASNPQTISILTPAFINSLNPTNTPIQITNSIVIITQNAINGCNNTINYINYTYGNLLKNLDNQLPRIISMMYPKPPVGNSFLTEQIIPMYTDSTGKNAIPAIEPAKTGGVEQYPMTFIQSGDNIELLTSNFKGYVPTDEINNAIGISKIKCDVTLKNKLSLLIKQLNVIQPLMDIIFQINPKYIPLYNFGEQIRIERIGSTNLTFAMIPGLGDLQQKQLPLNVPMMARVYATYYTMALNILCAGV